MVERPTSLFPYIPIENAAKTELEFVAGNHSSEVVRLTIQRNTYGLYHMDWYRGEPGAKAQPVASVRNLETISDVEQEWLDFSLDPLKYLQKQGEE